MTWHINYQGGGDLSRSGGTTAFSGIEDIFAGSGDNRFIFAQESAG